MTWAYSPSYGKPLSVPQGVIGLMTRLGMDVTLAYPEGYEVMEDVVEVAKKNAAEQGGKFEITNSMAEASRMRTWSTPRAGLPSRPWKSARSSTARGIWRHQGPGEAASGPERQHKDWECTEEMMKLTKDGKAMYLHCLPADITDVSCEAGEVAASVFDRYRDPLYKEASYKPYIIAAMIFLAKVKDPVAKLQELEARAAKRHDG